MLVQIRNYFATTCFLSFNSFKYNVSKPRGKLESWTLKISKFNSKCKCKIFSCFSNQLAIVYAKKGVVFHILNEGFKKNEYISYIAF